MIIKAIGITAVIISSWFAGAVLSFKSKFRLDDLEELKKAMEENLTALVGKIPGLLTLEFVACPFGSSTHDMALVSTFEKEEDISVYAKHPAHVAVADTYVRPFVTERACLDY